MLGLLTFKPQFCILVPMALIAAAVMLDAGVHDLAISDAEPPLLFPVARIAPLFPVLLIVLLLRPAPPATSAIAPSPAG